MFDYVSDGNLKWEDMGEVYDRVIIGDKKYDFVKGVENFKKKLIGILLASNGGIDQIAETIGII